MKLGRQYEEGIPVTLRDFWDPQGSCDMRGWHVSPIFCDVHHDCSAEMREKL